MHMHCSKHLREAVLTQGVAIPADHLTISRVILSERVKVMIVIALIHLCFGVESPLSYIKKFKQNDSTTHEYSLEGFCPISKIIVK